MHTWGKVLLGRGSWPRGGGVQSVWLRGRGRQRVNSGEKAGHSPWGTLKIIGSAWVLLLVGWGAAEEGVGTGRHVPAPIGVGEAGGPQPPACPAHRVAVPGVTYRTHFRRVIKLQPGHHAASFQYSPWTPDVLHPATVLHIQGRDHLHGLFCTKK